MKEWSNFKEELTMLQYIGEQCGMVVKMSPKCHCKVAGKCIEIIWGIGKVRLCRTPIAYRQTIDDFRGLVPSIWSGQNIGRKELSGAFWTHCSYILAYYDMHCAQAAAKGLSKTDILDAGIVKAQCRNLDYKTIQKKMKNY